jgi:iron complex transport system substrate-binding protein
VTWRRPDLGALGDGPRRIVSLAPSNTEILYALGEGERLAAVTRHCDFPSHAADKPRIGGFLRADVEAIVALGPDLVLASSFLHQEVVRALVGAELRVVCMNPTSLAGALDDFVFLGRLVGREDEGRALAAAVAAELEAAAEAGRRLQRRPRVYLEEWGPSEPYYMAGDWAAEMIALAGGDNVFADRPLRVPSPERVVRTEEIVARDPDLCVAAWCGIGEGVDRARLERRFAGTPLGRPERLRVVDDTFVMRPGPRIAEGVRRLHALFAAWAQGAEAR